MAFYAAAWRAGETWGVVSEEGFGVGVVGYALQPRPSQVVDVEIAEALAQSGERDGLPVGRPRRIQNLIDFVAEVFAHADSSPEEARRIATYLTTANLT